MDFIPDYLREINIQSVVLRFLFAAVCSGIIGTSRGRRQHAAGLIDGDETAEQAARRELKEETGLNITKIKDILKPSFSCSGVTDEKSVIIFCEVDGEIEKCDFPDEEIQAGLYTKEEVKILLRNECFSARSQAVCYLWAKD